MTLQEFFVKHSSVALGFSGGVDSSYLLHEAKKYCQRVQAYFVKSPFQPNFELEDAKRMAEQLGVPLTVIVLDILENIHVVENPSNRCYYCKTAIFSCLRERAKQDGYTVLIDGSNASDEAAERPGMQALTELSVLSPLRECGLTKLEIRQLSKEAGLFTWDKPAYACLATRVPTGRVITKEILERIEVAEEKLTEMGFSDFRVRIIGEAAKLELPVEQMAKAIAKREQLLQSLEFKQIFLDLNGR